MKGLLGHDYYYSITSALRKCQIVSSVSVITSVEMKASTVVDTYIVDILCVIGFGFVLRGVSTSKEKL